MAKVGLGHAMQAGVNGYLRGMGIRKQMDDAEEEVRDKAAAREERDLRLSSARRQAADQQELRDAGRPVQLEQGAGGMIRPPTMDDRDVGLPENQQMPNQGLSVGSYRAGDKTFTERTQAESEVGAQNSPVGATLRQAEVLRKQGRTTEATALEKRAREMQEEGYFDAARAARRGNPQEVFDTFNKAGSMKFEGVPEVKEVEREIPGIGKVKTYDYTGTIVGPDGRKRSGTINSHDFSMQVMPYEKAIDMQRRGAEAESRMDARAAQLENQAKKLELQGMLNEARIMRLQAQGGGSKLDREERMRFTTLFTDAGRRIQDVRKSMDKLQGDRLFMRKAGVAGSAEERQLSGLRAELEELNQERIVYRDLLAGGSKKEPGLADAKPSAAPKPANDPKQPVKVSSKAERDKLPKGTRYVGPDGQTYVKQ